MAIDASARPTVGREPSSQQLDAALDALDGGAAACIAARGRAGDRQDAPAATSCAAARRSAATSCWPGRPRSSSATCRSASGPTRWTPTSPRRSIELPTPASLARASCPRCGRPGRGRRRRRRALPRAPRGAPPARACSPRTARSSLVLDDLHWSDGASIELIAALAAPRPAAPVLLALAVPRRAGARAARRGAGACPAVRRLALEPARPRRDAAAAARRARRARRGRDLSAQAGGNPFYLEQLARVAPDDRRRRRTRGGDGVPAAVAASLAEELSAAVGGRARRSLEGAAVAGEPFEPDLAAAIGRARRADGLDRARRAARARPRAPDGRAAALRLPPSARAPRRLRVDARRLAAAPRTRARRTRWPRAARRRPSAPTTSSRSRGAGRRGGDRGAHARPGAATAPRAPARRGALVRGRAAAAARRRRPSARSTSRVALASALRSLGELERCRATLLEAIELLPAGDAVAARRADRAVRRGRALARAPRGRPPAARARLGGAARPRDRRPPPRCGSSSPSTALYELDFEQTHRGAARARSRPPRRSATAALIAAAAAALVPGRGVRRRARRRAREHRDEARRRSTGSPTPSSRRGWRRSTTSAGRRTTSSATTTRSRTPIAGSRSRGRPARAGCSCR